MFKTFDLYQYNVSNFVFISLLLFLFFTITLILLVNYKPISIPIMDLFHSYRLSHIHNLSSLTAWEIFIKRLPSDAALSLAMQNISYVNIPLVLWPPFVGYSSQRLLKPSRRIGVCSW